MTRPFIWGAGIESSSLPHINVDQFTWTQHNRFWKDDFRIAVEELGITHLRYAFPWHAIEPERGQFNWAMADERIEEAGKLGLNLMLDVMHFGTPLWLRQAVGDPEFPEALEQYTSAMVERYRGSVAQWCPFNEPLVTALFSGDFGFWPPHSRRWHGYMPVLSRIVQAVSRSIRAIRRTAADATVLLCDAAESYRAREASLQDEVNRRNLRRFLAMDLLTGRVDAHHPLHSWLVSFGLSELDLEWFRSHPQSPDILGLDYYQHSDWQLEMHGKQARQSRAHNAAGLSGIANAYYQRYGIPLMVTETSVEGQPINREIWLDDIIDHIRRLRETGVPMLGLIWWPMLDQIDWDGALLHRVGKIHRVGLYTLERAPDGTLDRRATPLAKQFRDAAAQGEALVGSFSLEQMAVPSMEADEAQLPPIGQWIQPTVETGSMQATPSKRAADGNGSNGNGHGRDSVAAAAAPPREDEADASTAAAADSEIHDIRATDRYGIVVFCHLRWGFVWQRPQQFLSRLARKHSILFIEEPFFDLKEGDEPYFSMHKVMPNVTVLCPHAAPSWNHNPELPHRLLKFAQQGIAAMNEQGHFDAPLLWYYSPMDSAWSLGHIPNRGIVYDAMDELSQFTGAPPQLVAMEARLMEHADIVFTGGYELSLKKKQQHDNVRFFGCGVEIEHFGKALEPNTVIPPDIDFMARPILGWFGVIDERVDYNLVGEIARMRPGWSIAMIGPVVKMDPNLLPHFPNLFWLGGRDYQVLPNYCKAFDICMMCFAQNAATQYINPTKALEYMATGRPILSTPVKDVVRQYSGLVEIASTAEEWVAIAERLLAEPDPAYRERRLAKARESGWDSTVRQMQDLIRHAITSPNHRSARKIAPLTNAELHYHFQPTPGS